MHYCYSKTSPRELRNRERMKMKSLVWLVSAATILGVSISNIVTFWSSSSFWLKFFFIAALAATVILAVIDIRGWWKGRVKCHRNEKSVNEYMLKLLNRGGSVKIFANNLSWVRDAHEVRAFLESAAGNGRDIRIFVPKLNDLTTELAANGVMIHTYSNLNYEPSARFTLLNPDEPGSSLLAIGKGTFPHFYIEEFSDQTHSRVLAVARDLLNILERLNEND
jgi:hypothetical protein